MELGYFSASGSSFTIRKLSLTFSIPFAPDNVEWTKDGSIFVQMDNSDGGIVLWKNNAVSNVYWTFLSSWIDPLAQYFSLTAWYVQEIKCLLSSACLLHRCHQTSQPLKDQPPLGRHRDPHLKDRPLEDQ
ncbi:hypothetical protein ACHAXA_009763 [Cyclostephanos tholiformis]|uniref:Bulb-type lectin domain-containing protein n=1 Tax=Cyclostephanos tholiformis TaxID=382380 RepID=A0ABD3SGQ4_9STRA